MELMVLHVSRKSKENVELDMCVWVFLGGVGGGREYMSHQVSKSEEMLLTKNQSEPAPKEQFQDFTWFFVRHFSYFFFRLFSS
jgi:hypothetical protein